MNRTNKKKRKTKREADSQKVVSLSSKFTTHSNTKKMQLPEHNLLQRKKKKKRVSRKLKGLNDIALLVGSECSDAWLPHSIASQTKTHHMMTDTTAVTIWIPLRLVYNKKKKKKHGSQVWASILRSSRERILDTHPFEKNLTS